jgi:hypothetical protein
MVKLNEGLVVGGVERVDTDPPTQDARTRPTATQSAAPNPDA